MKFAYLILAHKNPKQLARLVGKLCADDSLIFIHIDKKIPQEAFELEINNLQVKNVHFVKERKNIIWGGFNMIKTTLNGLKEIIESKEDISHVTLLSGQDYLLKPITTYHQFLLQHAGKSFIEHEALPFAHIPHKGMDRIGYYHWIFTRKIHIALPLISFLQVRSAYAKKGKLAIIRKIVHIFPKAKPYPRKFIAGMTPYYGSQWWVLAIDAVKYIFDAFSHNKLLYDFFEHTHIPDEMFFQSILLNAEEKISKNILNQSLQYINWAKPRREHPEDISLEDLDEILKSGKFIARKFEAEQDTAILDKLDEIHAQLK